MAASTSAHARKRERTAMVSVPLAADSWHSVRSEVVDWLMECAATQRVLWFPVEEALAHCPRFAALRQSNAFHACHLFQQAVTLSRVGRATAPSCFLSHPGTAVAVQASCSNTSISCNEEAAGSEAYDSFKPSQHEDPCRGNSDTNNEPTGASKDKLSEESESTRKEGRIMDDLHNLWGIVLMKEQYQGRYCIPGLLPRPVSKPRTEQGEMAALAMLERNHIPKLAPGYEVFTFQASGSQANCVALLDACGYNCAKAWVANSCYVAGGNNWLREAACMFIEDKQTKQLVQQPQGSEQRLTASGVRRLNLPYYAQELGVSWSSQELRTAEERALQYISSLLVNGEMKALLLEVVGCLTGLQLSMRFLGELLKVMNKYGGKLVVDEIMTAGRTGPLFLASTDTSSSQFQPHYITLGKWCQQGVVLRHRSLSSSKEVLSTQGVYTGETLGGSIVACEHAFAAIKGKLDNRTDSCNSLRKSVDASRTWCTQLLHQLVNSDQKEKAQDPVFWGKGCIVFANISMPRPTTLRCRFLPTLRTSTKAAAGHKQVDLAYAGSVNGIPYSQVSKPVVSQDLLEFHSEWMHQMLHDCGK